MASRAKVKVTVKTGRKGDAGTLVARVPVSVARTDRPKGQFIYQTRAQLNVHVTNKNGRHRSRGGRN